TSKLVDHGSPLPAIRTSKYTVLPSDENAYSALLPSGFDGTSPSMPRVSRMGLDDPSSGITNNCPRRWSDHSSQCRTNKRWYSRPVALTFLCASSFSRVHSSVVQSSNICEENSSDLPSGDNLKLSISSGSCVTCTGSPPATGADHSCVESLSVARKSRVITSGENAGPLAFNFRSLMRRGSAPLLDKSSSHTLLTPLLASQSVLRTANAASLPLGDRCGSDTRSIIA